ncbi:MAG: hypothetical protein V4559_11030 [Pseudomonadota bacterium]
MLDLRTMILGASLCLAVTPALAQNSNMQSMPGMNMPGMNMNMQGMAGMHDMSAVVSAVDPKTGIVAVTAGGMELKLHFPPASIADLKKGDAITVHLSFTKK